MNRRGFFGMLMGSVAVALGVRPAAAAVQTETSEALKALAEFQRKYNEAIKMVRAQPSPKVNAADAGASWQRLNQRLERLEKSLEETFGASSVRQVEECVRKIKGARPR